MEVLKKTIRIYAMANGQCPYEDWLHGLKDVKGRAKIRKRVDRLADGNPGKYRYLGDRLFEMKIDFGPGYRVYYGEAGKTLVILLCGGDKSTQERKDMDAAVAYWADCRRSK